MKVAEITPIATRNGIKQPGLSVKNHKQFQTPTLSTSTTPATHYQRSLKRMSDITAEQINLSTRALEEDEDDELMSNFDLEALFRTNSSVSKRQKL